MTNCNKQITFLCTSLALLLPFPGRIAFGIFALVHFNICVVLLTLILHAIKRLGFEKLRLGICAMELVAITILYRQLLAIFCPVASLTLGFSLYLSAASSVCVVLLNFHNKNSIKADCLEKFKNAIYLSAFVLIIYVLRDVLGFGTVSLPAWKNLFIVKIPVLLNQTSFTDFFATIPGCMLLITLIFFAYTKLIGEKMLRIIFFYLFSGSLVLFYGIGLNEELTLKKTVLSWLKSICEALLITLSTVSLTYFLSKFCLLRLGVEELAPFIAVLFFAGICFGLKKIIKSNYFNLSEKFIIPFLIVLVSLSEGFSFLSTVLICACCVFSFYLFMILVFSIRKRFSLYQKDAGLKTFYILLLSLAAVFVAIYGFNSSWLMLGLKS